MIPNNLFQTWKTKDVSSGFKSLMNRWREFNPKFNYHFFDDKDCEDFLIKFDKRVYDIYCQIIPGAFKADLWRLCALYELGGFYCDVDTYCLGSITDFVNDDTEFIAPVDLNLHLTPDEGEHNLFNTFIGASPGSDIIFSCIERIIYNVENNVRTKSKLDFSACGVLGRALNMYWRLPETTSMVGKEGIHGNVHLLKFEPGTEYVKNVDGRVLFQNKNGNPDIQSIYKAEANKVNIVSWVTAEHWTTSSISKAFL